MLDNRILTFLQLCETMNYRKTAEQLNMTQPAVTQHIHYLEEEYGCKLFSYSGRVLRKTKATGILEQRARVMLAYEKELRQAIQEEPPTALRLGVTKTIGEYVLGPYVERFLKNPEHSLTMTVDNTQTLLQHLNHNEIDFAILEGFFDKNRYAYRLFQEEAFLGLCSKNHPFAGRQIAIEDIFSETLLIREQGSGTRALLEQLLRQHGHSLAQFQREICISSFAMLRHLVSQNLGITFAYQSVTQSSGDVATFQVRGADMIGEFNFVFLKGLDANAKIEYFMNQ